MRLIDADAVLRQIRHRTADIIFRGEQTMITGKDSCNPAEWTRGYEQGVRDTVNVIGLQKVIEAEPVKHGQWVTETTDKQERKISVTCSECEAFFSLNLFDFGLLYNFCPNCGARMKGEKTMNTYSDSTSNTAINSTAYCAYRLPCGYCEKMQKPCFVANNAPVITYTTTTATNSAHE